MNHLHRSLFLLCHMLVRRRTGNDAKVFFVQPWGRRQDARRTATTTASANNNDSESKHANSSDNNNNLSMQVVHEMRQQLREDGSHHQQQGWNNLWEQRLTPWDLGFSTPALHSELAKDLIRNSDWWHHHRRTRTLRSLVPGCGSGYDLRTLLQHHNKVMQSSSDEPIVAIPNENTTSLVVGLDISPISLERARQLVLNIDDNNDQHHIETADTTELELMLGDFFDSTTWTTSTLSQSRNKDASQYDSKIFDFIFDYTFFCALPPSLRSAWGEQISTLLHPQHGRLLTLIFPILSSTEYDRMQGPPFPVTRDDYERVLNPWGLELEEEPYESLDTIPSRKGKELIGWWKRRN